MAVTVLFFASIAEAAGTRSLCLETGGGETVADLRDRLIAQMPQLARFVPTLLYAVDEVYAKPAETVPDGSTLALIPPVSGG